MEKDPSDWQTLAERLQDPDVAARPSSPSVEVTGPLDDPAPRPLTQERVQALLRDPSTRSEAFDEEMKENFILVWERRRMMAMQYSKRDNFRILAEHVLDFVRDRPAGGLRMCTSCGGLEITCFLFDTQTHEFLQIQ